MQLGSVRLATLQRVIADGDKQMRTILVNQFFSRLCCQVC